MSSHAVAIRLCGFIGNFVLCHWHLGEQLVACEISSEKCLKFTIMNHFMAFIR